MHTDKEIKRRENAQRRKDKMRTCPNLEENETR